MTPIGAGVFPAALAGHIVGHDGMGCWKCESGCTEHSGETLLGWFAERSLIIRDNHLVVVKNFLAFNRPDNPNQLAGYIGYCEQLPRSKAFLTLRDHLRKAIPAIPEWIFSALLDPLAEQQNKTLSSMYWQRVKEAKEGSGEPYSKRLPKGSLERLPEGMPKASPKQEQEQEQDKTIPPIVPRGDNGNGKARRKTITIRTASSYSEDWSLEPWPSEKKFISLYNQMAPTDWPLINTLSNGVSVKIQEYVKQFPDVTWWHQTFRNCCLGAFLRQYRNRGLLWLLQRGQHDQVENCAKVHDGRYLTD